MTPDPSMPVSSKQQDARESTREVMVQVQSAGSIVRSIDVRPASRLEVQPLVVNHHYLHSMPAGARACYGIYLFGDLHGAAVFTAGARQGHKLLAAARPQDVVTLARLWLSDTLPRNSESRVLGIVLRSLKKTTDWKLILSYADPLAGHTGIIYRASGWLYLGQTEANSYVDLGDNTLHHPRSIYSRYGSNNIRHLRATGVPARRVAQPGKHRYAYVLDPAWRWRVR